MTSKGFFRHFAVTSPVCRLLLAGLCAGESAAFEVDGIRNTVSETGYTVHTVQTIQSSGGQENVLANLHSAVTDANLRLFIGGRAKNAHAILLFIDTKDGGVPMDGQGPFIPNNLILPNEFSWMINNLGASATGGMRFESGFQPDYAIRIQGAGNNNAPVHRFDLQANTANLVGDAVPTKIGGGFISEICCNWVDVSGDYKDALKGVEMSLNLPLMGVPTSGGTIKILAMLVTHDSLAATNQTLASLSPKEFNTQDPIDPTHLFNFQDDDTGVQTLSLEVEAYAVSDSDGEGLLDEYETNDGIYHSSTATGSNPFEMDTDGDSYSDSLEVSGNALGFVSNPNIANYSQIHAPGSFDNESLVPVIGSTEMTRLGIGLEQQFIWQRDYKIPNTFSPGLIRFRFISADSTPVSWGPGPGPGTVALNIYNINGNVPATGFYQFEFNQAALSYTFGRKVFPDVEAYLAAYQLAAGGHGDGDGIPNEDEFAANTDPTNTDSDNDGRPDDNTDPDPLLAYRDITFSVNMSVQENIGAFNPAVDSVKVQFFDRIPALSDLALVNMEGGIHSATLSSVEGAAGASFGGYKFVIIRPGSASEYPEDPVLNRGFPLGSAHVTQEIDTVFFNNIEGLGSPYYIEWTTQFAGNLGPSGQDFDDDGFTNQEEFLFGTHPEQPTSTLTPMFRQGDNLVFRWNERDSYVTYYVEQSSDLSPGLWVPLPDFDPVPVFPLGLPEGYTQFEAIIPINAPRKFLRVRAIEE